MIRRQPRSTRTDTLFPYTTLVRSDGRGFTLQGHEEGFFVGPTLFDHVTPDMESYKEEIFGPVLQIVRAADFEAALELPSKHQYGNGVAIFTRNRSEERRVGKECVSKCRSRWCTYH